MHFFGKNVIVTKTKTLHDTHKKQPEAFHGYFFVKMPLNFMNTSILSKNEWPAPFIILSILFLKTAWSWLNVAHKYQGSHSVFDIKY